MALPLAQEIFHWILFSVLLIEYAWSIIYRPCKINWNRRASIIKWLFAQVCNHAILALLTYSLRVSSANLAMAKLFFVDKCRSLIWRLIDYFYWRVVRNWHRLLTYRRLRFLLRVFLSNRRKFNRQAELHLKGLFILRASNQTTHLLIKVACTRLRIFVAQRFQWVVSYEIFRSHGSPIIVLNLDYSMCLLLSQIFKYLIVSYWHRPDLNRGLVLRRLLLLWCSGHLMRHVRDWCKHSWVCWTLLWKILSTQWLWEWDPLRIYFIRHVIILFAHWWIYLLHIYHKGSSMVCLLSHRIFNRFFAYAAKALNINFREGFLTSFILPSIILLWYPSPVPMIHL